MKVTAHHNDNSEAIHIAPQIDLSKTVAHPRHTILCCPVTAYQCRSRQSYDEDMHSEIKEEILARRFESLWFIFSSSTAKARSSICCCNIAITLSLQKTSFVHK